ncbi:MAG: RNA pseudouridine synthase, partial [Planctomycetota bacterium]
NHLLVVNKPAGIATMGAQQPSDSLHAMATEYLKHRYNKPGNAFVGVVSRLDTVTSGVIVLAKTSKAASRLSDQIRRGSQFAASRIADLGTGTNLSRDALEECLARVPFHKTYVALLEHPPADQSGVLLDWMYKDDAARRMRCRERGKSSTDQDRAAVLAYQMQQDQALNATFAALGGHPVCIHLLTGRKHQIRVQMQHHGHAILGDHKYGSTIDFPGWHPGEPPRIALHSRTLRFHHPTLKTELEFTASAPWEPQ